MDADYGGLAAVQQRIREGLSTRIIGQDSAIQQILTAFFAGGHILVIGVPGLAKTLMIRSLSELLDLQFSRVQFTPDLMPQDITGTSILTADSAGSDRGFRFRKGPLFANLMLGDEINRTPPKTQAALLEAMEEGQVTVMGRRHKLPVPFFVMATQNPLDQEGTYALPSTQLDRFAFQVMLDYPDASEELDVVSSTTARIEEPLQPVIPGSWITEAIEEIRKVEIPDWVLLRAIRLVRATRPGEEDGSDVARELLSHGAGPRGIQTMLTTSRALAALRGRNTVIAEDLDEVILPSLRHRIVLSVHADAEGLTQDDVIQRVRESIGDLDGDMPGIESRELGFLRRWLEKLSDTTPDFKAVK
ncbi:MAG: MoxR family ATPase [Planctomycetota bacterium]|nr:MoxR family ATPase [Planctomycetota bacterium]